MKKRAVFYLSDGTALTVKSLGKSLLSLFSDIKTVEFWRPFINTKPKIIAMIEEINLIRSHYQEEPIIFVSIVNEQILNILLSSFPKAIDILSPFIFKLENELQLSSSKLAGQAHKPKNKEYEDRIMAMDFTLSCDDGLKCELYTEADIILLGLSRSGKTPTSIYLAMQFDLKVANFPFVKEDLPVFSLNDQLKKNRQKLFGLNIQKDRLLAIRSQRRALGTYANPGNIQEELNALELLYKKEKIPYLDTTYLSVEEIASSIMFLTKKSDIAHGKNLSLWR